MDGEPIPARTSLEEQQANDEYRDGVRSHRAGPAGQTGHRAGDGE